jgi:hypothetical protein
MTRLLFSAIDFGASLVFMTLCAKAFCVHFYKDIKQRLNLRRLPGIDATVVNPGGVRQAASCIGSINVGSSASA